MVPNGTCGKLKLYLKPAKASSNQGKKTGTRGKNRRTRRAGNRWVAASKVNKFTKHGNCWLHSLLELTRPKAAYARASGISQSGQTERGSGAGNPSPQLHRQRQGIFPHLDSEPDVQRRHPRHLFRLGQGQAAAVF